VGQDRRQGKEAIEHQRWPLEKILVSHRDAEFTEKNFFINSVISVSLCESPPSQNEKAALRRLLLFPGPWLLAAGYFFLALPRGIEPLLSD
jgi:hypothetical protein